MQRTSNNVIIHSGLNGMGHYPNENEIRSPDDLIRKRVEAGIKIFESYARDEINDKADLQDRIKDIAALLINCMFQVDYSEKMIKPFVKLDELFKMEYSDNFLDMAKKILKMGGLRKPEGGVERNGNSEMKRKLSLAAVFNVYLLGAYNLNPQCMYNLGISYHYGFHGEKDIQEAIFWMHRGALEGNYSAQEFFVDVDPTLVPSEYWYDIVLFLMHFERSTENIIDQLLTHITAQKTGIGILDSDEITNKEKVKYLLERIKK